MCPCEGAEGGTSADRAHKDAYRGTLPRLQEDIVQLTKQDVPSVYGLTKSLLGQVVVPSSLLLLETQARTGALVICHYSLVFPLLFPLESESLEEDVLDRTVPSRANCFAVPAIYSALFGASCILQAPQNLFSQEFPTLFLLPVYLHLYPNFLHSQPVSWPYPAGACTTFTSHAESRRSRRNPLVLPAAHSRLKYMPIFGDHVTIT